MPVRPSLRKKTAVTIARELWTAVRCGATHRYTEDEATAEARRLRTTEGADVIHFRCVFCGGWHVGTAPLACKACQGTGQNSKGTNECVPCQGTGVRTT